MSDVPSGVEAPDGHRVIAPWAAIALVVGSMLGIGIFIAPPQVARFVGSASEFLGLWLVAAVLVWAGAVSVAELGAAWPRSGGDYLFLCRAFGPAPALAVGYLQLLAIFPGSLATVSLALVQHQLSGLFGAWMTASVSFAGGEWSLAPVWALAIVLMLTVVNHLGVRISARVQLALTSLPIAVLFVASLVLLFNADPHWVSDRAPLLANESGETMSLGHRWAHAFLPVYFAYSGWNNAIYVAGEIHNPGQSVPRAFRIGVGLVAVLYLLACAAFIAVEGLEGIRQAIEVGSVVAERVWGSYGRVGLLSLIALALLGSLNATVLAGAQISRAMASDGRLWSRLAHQSSRFATAAPALWLQAGLTALLFFASSALAGEGDGADLLGALMRYVSSAMLIAGSLTVLCVPILRRKSAGTTRPYRTPTYLGVVWPAWLHAAANLTVLVLASMSGDPSVWVPVAVFVAVLLGRRIFR